MHEWDPIGVAGSEGAEDKYDSYVAKAYVMMKDGASAEEIVAYLIDIEVNHMGSSMNDSKITRAERTVAELMKLKA